MADSTTVIDTIAVSQADKETTANGFFDAASHAAMFGRRQSTTDGLTWGYYGGRIGGTAVANGSLSLTADRINYIVLHRTTFAVSVSVVATNWCTPQTYARLYKVTCDSLGVTAHEDRRFGAFGVWCDIGLAVPFGRVEFRLPVSADLTTSITTGTDKAYMRVPSRVLLTDVRASLFGESTSGLVTVDINANGQSILGTKLTVDANEKTSVTAAAQYAFNDGGDAVDDDTPLTVDIDGAGTSAEGLAITLIGLRGVGDPGRELVVSELSLEASPWVDGITSSGLTWLDQFPTISSAQSLNSVSSLFASNSTLFNGATQRLATTTNSPVFDLATAPWCLDLWVWASATTGVKHVLEIGNGQYMRISINLSGSGALQFYTVTSSSNGGARITGSAISTSTWYHLRLAYDLTTYYFFQDGALLGTSTTSIRPSGSSRVILGNVELGDSPGSTYAWPGHLQRWRFTRGWHRSSAAFSRPLRPYATYGG